MNLLTQCCGLSILIAQLIFILTQKSLKLFRQRIFMWVLGTTGVSVILDILSVLCICNQASLPPLLVKLVCKLYIVSLSWDGWVAYIYMMLDTIPRKTYTKLIMCMGIFNQVVSIITFLLPIEIVYDGNNLLYTQGPSTLVVYTAAAIYSVLIICTCLTTKQHINPRKRLGMLLWVIFLVTTALIQFFFKQILIIGFGMSLGSLILFVLMENPESNIDKRLGCFNSYAKSVYLASLWDEKNDFSILKIYFNPTSMSGLDEADRTLVLRQLSTVLSAQGKFCVFKENDSSFSVISTDCAALEEHANQLWVQISGHDLSKGRTTMMLLKNPRLLKDAVEAENIFAFALDEGLADTHYVNILDEKTIRMFHVRKLLVEDASAAAGYAEESAFLGSREQRLKSLEIIDLFASEYAAVFHIDTVTGALTPYAMNGEEFNDLIQPFENGMQFMDAYEIFLSRFVFSEDLDKFKADCKFEKISAELREHRSYSILFRCYIHAAEDPLHCEMKFMKFSGEGDGLSSFVLGIANRDDAIKKSQAEALQQSQYHAVIQALSSEYASIYYADLSSDLIIPYASSDRVTEYVGEKALKKVPFTGAVQAYIRSIVAEEDKQLMSDVLTVDNIRKELADKQYFTQIYHNEIGQYCEMKCVRTDELALVEHVVVGFAVKDEEVRKRLAEEEQLKAALEATESANKSKTDFLFNMSHDIRTPMNAITGFTRMAIRDIHNPEKVLDYLHKTQKAGDMLLSLINDILDMSRIESGHVQLNEQPGDVGGIFSDIEPMMQELAKDKRIQLEFFTGNIADRFACFDAMRTERILVNIISNAIKYTPEGGLVKACCAEQGKDEQGRGIFLFTVEDSGIGMSEEFQQHLFEQFSREENATTSKIQGTGLGLALCKSLTDLMGGTIGVVSIKDVGSTFTVTLPLHTVNETAVTECEKQSGVSTGEDILAGKRVLLVDDNELNREIAEDILSEAGLSVESAESGSDAINLVSGNAPDYYDFILMDIQMPVMNGYETTTAIRKLASGSRIPIIALSANAFEEDKQKSIAAGMNDHVAKPIKVDELKLVMAKLL